MRKLLQLFLSVVIVMKKAYPLILLALLLGQPILSAQSTPTRENDPQAPGMNVTISVGSVVIPFVVTERNGHVYKKLREKDVALLIDGRPVTTDLFDTAQDAPISYTILLDVSGSMELAGKMDGARAALRELVAHGASGDEYALYTFAEGAVREMVPFTHDGRAILAAVDRVEPYGKTAFFDALAAIPDRSLLGSNPSRAIILLTDGIDNASTLGEPEMEKLFEGVEVPVYPMGLRTLPPSEVKDLESSIDLQILGQIAYASGGRMAVTEDPASLAQAIRDMQQDLRFQYLIGFTPTGHGRVTYRRIALKISGPTRFIRVRAGYHGTEPPVRGGSTSKKKKK